MGYKDEEQDPDLPEAPSIQMVTETFSQVIVTPENNSDNHNNDKE